MTVHVVIREDQSEHGFVDTSIAGLFQNRSDAAAFMESSISEARRDGIRVCGDPGCEPDWEVCWFIESHSLA